MMPRHWYGAFILIGWLWAASPALAASIDEALSSLENVSSYAESMPYAGPAAASYLKVQYKEYRRFKAAHALVQVEGESRFVPKVYQDSVRQALAAVDEAETAAMAEDLARIAKVVARTEAELASLPDMSPPEREAREQELTALLAAREDRDTINTVVAQMAEPMLAQEPYLAIDRLFRVGEMRVVNDVTEIQAIPKAALTQGLRSDILNATRANPSDAALGTTRTIHGEWAAMRKQHVLATLSRDDVALLARFYGSEAGRAKRDALLQAFAQRADADALAALLAVIEAPAS